MKILKFISGLLMTFCLLLLVKVFTVMNIEINQTSMYPTLYDKESGYADKVFYKLSGLKRGDIIVFQKESSSEDKLLVKRVIALPNETIKYVGANLYIDNNLVEEDYLSESAKLSTLISDNYTLQLSTTGIKLNENEYFVMGDNRQVSIDSRNFGPIKYSSIKGKVFLMKNQNTLEWF